MLKTKLNELYNKIHFEETDNQEKLIKEFNINYNELSKKLITEEKYFFIGAPLNIFTEYFNNHLVIKGKEIIDFSEAEYIKDLYSKTFKLFNYNNPYPQIPSEQPIKMTNHALLDLLNNSNKSTIKRIIKRRLEFLETELYKRGYTIEKEYQEFIEQHKLFFLEDPIKKNEYLLQCKNSKVDKLIKSVEWKGTVTELTALIKSLVESNKLDASLTEKEVVQRFEQFFNYNLKNYSQNNTKIGNRTKDFTPFLDTIKTNLENWIKSSDKRKQS
jgi:hypothetical protein